DVSGRFPEPAIEQAPRPAAFGRTQPSNSRRNPGRLDPLAIGGCQVVMQVGHHQRAITHPRRDTLDRTRPDVADRKDSGTAGLQYSASLFAAREHESFAVERDTGAIEPGAVGIRTNEQEEMTDRFSYFVKLGSSPTDRFEDTLCSLKSTDRRLRHHLDIRCRADALDEVTRHAGPEVFTTQQQPHLADNGGEIDRSLTRGVA